MFRIWHFQNRITKFAHDMRGNSVTPSVCSLLQELPWKLKQSEWILSANGSLSHGSWYCRRSAIIGKYSILQPYRHDMNQNEVDNWGRPMTSVHSAWIAWRHGMCHRANHLLYVGSRVILAQIQTVNVGFEEIISIATLNFVGTCFPKLHTTRNDYITIHDGSPVNENHCIQRRGLWFKRFFSNSAGATWGSPLLLRSVKNDYLLHFRLFIIRSTHE